MDRKIDIRICTGTTCYVMGASDLLAIEDRLPEERLRVISISGSACLGLCRRATGMDSEESRLKPPFVRINGRLICRASPEKVLDAVNAEIEGADYAYDEE